MIACMVMTSVSVPGVVIKLTAALFLLGFVFECLVFVAFSSKVCALGCEFDKGAGAAVAAAIFALLACTSAAMIPPYHNEEVHSTPGYVMPGSVTVETTVTSDGNNVTKTTRANADGSLTVSKKCLMLQHDPFQPNLI